MLKPLNAVTTRHRGAFTPGDVCAARVHPALMKLYWRNEREEALIEHMAALLDPACNGALALAAVKARFAAVAGWAINEPEALALADEMSDDAVLTAMAEAPLTCTHGVYWFDHVAFAAALKELAHAERLRGARCLN